MRFRSTIEYTIHIQTGEAASRARISTWQCELLVQLDSLLQGGTMHLSLQNGDQRHNSARTPSGKNTIDNTHSDRRTMHLSPQNGDQRHFTIDNTHSDQRTMHLSLQNGDQRHYSSRKPVTFTHFLIWKLPSSFLNFRAASTDKEDAGLGTGVKRS
jgi:hypothetical protein